MAVLAEVEKLEVPRHFPCGPEVSSVHQYQEYREATLSFPIRLTSQKLTTGKYKMMKHFELIFPKTGTEGRKRENKVSQEKHPSQISFSKRKDVGADGLSLEQHDMASLTLETS